MTFYSILIFRQEFLGMQTKYTALEARSRDMVVQQGSAISCATTALTGLTTRLNSLVEQLITSYNISEQELEVCFSIINNKNNTLSLLFIRFFFMFCFRYIKIPLTPCLSYSYYHTHINHYYILIETNNCSRYALRY